MARANASDATKGAATAANATSATTGPQALPESTTAPAIAPSDQGANTVSGSGAVAGAETGPQQPTDPSSVASIDADPATAGTTTISPDAQTGNGDHVEADSVAEDSNELMIYPVRSYLDGKEVRRAGGKGYKSPKHDAVSLIAAGLATDKAPKS